MSALFRFSESAQRSPAVETWLSWQRGPLREVAKDWYAVIRKSGADVRELMHDGHPTACVGDAAFAYVDTFKSHVNVGFFCGADLPDPHGLLEGTGKRMRHVKIRPGSALDRAALVALIGAAYGDMARRVREEVEH